MDNKTIDATIIKVNAIEGVNTEHELRLNSNDAKLITKYLSEHPEIKTLDAGGVFLDSLFLDNSEDLLSHIKDQEITLKNFFGESETLTEKGIPFEVLPKEEALTLAAEGLREGRIPQTEPISNK